MLESPGARRSALRAATLAAGVAPLLWLLAAAAANGLGANPIEAITHTTGSWALTFLLVCLAVTPARRLTGWRMLTLERRTFGLFAFLYASLHLATYAVLELELDFGTLGEDISERPYITVGFGTWLILLALALTSTRAAARSLGKSWKKLHRLVYFAGIGAIVHFLWLVKADEQEPLIYGAALAVLLGARLWWLRLRRRRRPTPAFPSRGRT